MLDQNMNITIKDIARESGYSVGTVSRAINHSGSVSQAAQDAIFDVINRYGYKTNPNAKYLRQKNSEGAVIAVFGPSNRFLSDLAILMQKHLEELGIQAICSFIPHESDPAVGLQKIIAGRTPAGVIVLGADAQSFTPAFRQIHIPCVLAGNSVYSLPYQNLGSVCIDDAAAAQEAGEFLLAGGHRRIGVLGGDPACENVAADRYHGIQYAFYSRALPFSKAEQYVQCPYTYQGGYDGLMALKEKMPDLDAVFCMGDMIAVGALRAAADLGLRVPEDLSVVGFDGQEIGKYTLPRLTTVIQDAEFIALKSAEILCTMMCESGLPRENRMETQRVFAPWKLCLRQSARVPHQSFQAEEE